MDYVAADSREPERAGVSIDVALAFCDPRGTYSRHVAVVMASIFANTRSSVCVHILHDDTLTQENLSKLRQTADFFGQAVKFINVGEIFDTGTMDVSKLSADGARGTLFRLLIPQVLDCSKIIYLDCDVVVNIDLLDMWEADMGGCSVGAVRDIWSIDYLKGKKIHWRQALAQKVMGVKKGEYFNAGVLLMDLDKIRKSHDFIAEVAAFYKKYKKAISWADQDCLNHIFAGDTRLMSERFNCIRPKDLDDSHNLSAIWHMAGLKPWEAYTRPGVDELYWHYLAMTPWCASTDDLIKVMLKGLQSHKYWHRHSSDCVKRLKKQLSENIFRMRLWVLPYLLVALALHRPKKT